MQGKDLIALRWRKLQDKGSIEDGYYVTFKKRDAHLEQLDGEQDRIALLQPATWKRDTSSSPLCTN